jgi:hypothetical protein
VAAGNLIGVEGVDELVGEAEERHVADHLDGVEREAEQTDEGKSLAA